MGQTAGQGRGSAAVLELAMANCCKFSMGKNFRAVHAVTLVADGVVAKADKGSRSRHLRSIFARCGILRRFATDWGNSRAFSQGPKHETHRFSGGLWFLRADNLPGRDFELCTRRAGGHQSAASDSDRKSV